MNTAAQGEAPGEAVVADYLANRLSETDAQAFELYCLEHPDFARDVECELKLKTGMRQVHQPTGQVSVPTHKGGYRRWPLALAASVAVLASALFFIQYSRDRQPQLVAFTSVSYLPEQLRRAAVSEVKLARMRGSDTATKVLTSSDGVVEFRLIPDSAAESGVYSVRISAESTTAIRPLTVRGLKPTADGFLEVYVPAATLIGRTWVISVFNDAARAQSSETFRVEIAAEPGTSH